MAGMLSFMGKGGDVRPSGGWHSDTVAPSLASFLTRRFPRQTPTGTAYSQPKSGSHVASIAEISKRAECKVVNVILF
jgi:hypothetical protein